METIGKKEEFAVTIVCLVTFYLKGCSRFSVHLNHGSNENHTCKILRPLTCGQNGNGPSL